MSFKGISADNDARYTNAEKKLLQTTKFPPSFHKKVDMTKVNLQVIKPWVTERITSLLGMEDEVVIELVFSMLEETRYPDAKRCQINLTGFLHKVAGEFMKELWDLLMSAQESPGGIPVRLVEEKKKEMQARRSQDSNIRDRLEERHLLNGNADKSADGNRQQSLDDYEKPLRMRQQADPSDSAPTDRQSRTPYRQRAPWQGSQQRSRTTSKSPNQHGRRKSPRRGPMKTATSGYGRSEPPRVPRSHHSPCPVRASRSSATPERQHREILPHQSPPSSRGRRREDRQSESDSTSPRPRRRSRSKGPSLDDGNGRQDRGSPPRRSSYKGSSRDDSEGRSRSRSRSRRHRHSHKSHHPRHHSRDPEKRSRHRHHRSRRSRSRSKSKSPSRSRSRSRSRDDVSRRKRSSRHPRHHRRHDSPDRPSRRRPRRSRSVSTESRSQMVAHSPTDTKETYSNK